MTQIHLVQVLRKLNHPGLQEYLELSDQLEQLGCQAEQIDREAAAQEGRQWNNGSLKVLDQLEQRLREIRKQFWPVFYAVQELQERIVQSLHTPENRNYRTWKD
jgi:hypothetical protein